MEDFLKDKVILLVDDTPENIDVLNGILGHFKRKIATNGERALKIATGPVPPDLILLDIMMPGMDGYEVCRKLRANDRTKDLPVIFLTAKTAKEDIVKGFEAGGQDYVTKPFDPSELTERVKTQLKLRHQQKMLENMNEVLEQKVRERTAQLEESNQKLEEAFQKLQVLDQAKNNFLKLISHEIRTPLNGIIGSTYFLEDMVEDPELKEFIGIMKESVERLEHFSINALFLTQLETKRLESFRQPVNLSSVLHKVTEENKALAGKREVVIHNDLPLQVMVLGDEALAFKSMNEILNNALKFSTGQEVTVSLLQSSPTTWIKVTNAAHDIPEEKMEHILEAFGMADSHMDTNTGLGLAIVKACQELMEGDLKITSHNGKVTVTLGFRPAP